MEHRDDSAKLVVAMSSVGAGIFLTLIKLAVGLGTKSLGLLSEAAHSSLDFVAAFVTYQAVRLSDKPADTVHHYGHGKVENLAALIETILLLLTCGWIGSEAVKRLFFAPVEIKPTFWAFAVMVTSIVIDFSRSRALRSAAEKFDSQALEADALHFSTDIWSSLVVLLGLTLVKLGEMRPAFTGLQKADAIAALVVALIVVRVSFRLGKRAVEVLVDTAPAGAPDRIARAALAVDGVINCHKVRVRPSGNQSFVDLHVEVDRNLPFEKSHAIAEAVERHVESLIPRSNVLVHIDPAQREEEKVVERIRAIAHNQDMAVHNVSVGQHEEGMVVELHLEVDDHLSLDEVHAWRVAWKRKCERTSRKLNSSPPISNHVREKSSTPQL